MCDSEFVTYPSKIKLGRGKYCSKICCHLITDKILEENGKGTRIQKGQKPWNTKGWRYTQSRPSSTKYILLHMPGHPNCDPRGYVRAHRYLMEQKIGRPLTKDEVVHHIDEDGTNNNIDNLQLMTFAEHRRHHLKDNVHKRWQKIT